MAKPKAYTEKDAVKIACLKDYTVKAGSGKNAGEDVTFEAGKTYSVAPRSAMHLMRKVYNVRNKEGKYEGEGSHFVDEKAAKEMSEGEKARKAKTDKKVDEKVDEKADEKAAGKDAAKSVE